MVLLQTDHRDAPARSGSHKPYSDRSMLCWEESMQNHLGHTSTAVAAGAAIDHSMRPSQMSMDGSFLRPRECLLHFLMRVFLLHLAALFDSLTWQLLAVVLKTEGVSIMPCVHIFLPG